MLAAAFAAPLAHLVRFSIHNQLYSYIPLVPAISLWLVWSGRRSPSGDRRRPARALAAVALIAGAAAILAYRRMLGFPTRPAQEDLLSAAALGIVLIFAGLTLWIVDRARVRRHAFALAFLIFMVPLPVWLTDAVGRGLQYGSAGVATAFFSAAGTPYLYRNLQFQLPGITIEVAPECSGIHSTVALFLTSLLAGHLFFRRRQSRVLLSLAVIPLGLLRNGFRIWVIGELCVHWGPQMIDSPIHHRGGPIFFVLSLIPFFLLLVFLLRREHGRASTRNVPFSASPCIDHAHR